VTTELVVVGLAYLAGSVPSAYLVVLVLTGRDVRRTGSGNVGATNAVRAAGWTAGAMVAVIDVAKGLVPVLAMSALDPASRWLGAAATAAVLGHCFPVWLRFRGGKGVATACGAFATLAPYPVLIAAAVWLVVLAVRRIVSLASVIAVAVFPMLVVFVERAPFDLVVAATIVAAVIVIRHHTNIARLAAGTEPRIGERHPWDRDGGGE
jgi:glycerol-3-phosphate acyltransferase PlsY